MKMTARLLWLVSTATLLAGCDQTFNPDGPYDMRLVVYGVLSNKSSVQLMRVYATYPPQSNPGYQPSDNQVTDATVTVSRGGTVYLFRDTTIVRADSSRYQDPIRAKVAYGFPLAQAASYTLTVTSPTWGKASATVTSLYDGTVRFQNPAVFTSGTGDSVIMIAVRLGANVPAYIVRLFLVYDIHGLNPRSGEYVEIPIAIRNTSDPDSRYIYPSPLERGQGIPGALPGIETVLFSTQAYDETIARLTSGAGGDTVICRRAIAYMTQLDAALYAYYVVIHGLPNSAALRIDEPDYTNIAGGFGIFATSTVDTAAVEFP